MKALSGRFHAGFFGGPDPEKGALFFLIIHFREAGDLALAEAAATEPVKIDATVETLDVDPDEFEPRDGEGGAVFGVGEVKMQVDSGEIGFPFFTGSKDERTRRDAEMSAEEVAQHAASAGETLAMDGKFKPVGADTLFLIEPLAREGERQRRVVIETEGSHDDLGIGIGGSGMA